jgi:hypothetical protein
MSMTNNPAELLRMTIYLTRENDILLEELRIHLRRGNGVKNRSELINEGIELLSIKYGISQGGEKTR